MPVGLYEDPEIYDILHWPGTPAEVRDLLRLARRWVRPAGSGAPRWLEPACGTGRYLREAARRGIDALGFDLSPPMIRYARRAAGHATRPQSRPAPGRARFFIADMTDFARRVRPASIDLAFNLINTVRHLPSDRAMLAHLDGIARVLRPGGVYAVGLSLSAYGLEQEDEDVWEGRRAGTRVRQVVQYLPPARGRRERVISHVEVTGGGEARHSDSSYWLRCYDLEQWRRLLARSRLRQLAWTDEEGDEITMKPPAYAIAILAHPEE